MNSLKLRFMYFLKYWPIPFGIYKYVVKSKMLKGKLFLFLKLNKRLGNWLLIQHKQNHLEDDPEKLKII